MNIPIFIDTALSIITVILILSVLTSAIFEFIGKYTRSRSRLLAEAISKVLYDPGLKANYAELLYEHPLIKNLHEKTNAKPSYIDSGVFSEALVDTVVREFETEKLFYNRESESYELPEEIKLLDKHGKFTLALEHLNHSELATLLKTFDDSSDAFPELLKKLQKWYESYMERVGGWYKRRTQTKLFYIGLIMAVVLNVDLILISETIYKDSEARATLVSIGISISEAGEDSLDMSDLNESDLKDVMKESYANLKASGVPIGWNEPLPNPLNGDVCPFFRLVIGWLLTAFVVSRGAPFWFGTLSKLVNIRSTGLIKSKADE